MGLISRVSSRTYRSLIKMSDIEKMEDAIEEQIKQEKPSEDSMEKLEKMAKHERDLVNGTAAPTAMMLSELQTMPSRQYLDETVLPLLYTGMQRLVEERPPNPVDWLAHFLLKNKSLAPYASK